MRELTSPISKALVANFDLISGGTSEKTDPAHTFGRFRIASFKDVDLAILVRHVDPPVYVVRLATLRGWHVKHLATSINYQWQR